MANQALGIQSSSLSSAQPLQKAQDQEGLSRLMDAGVLGALVGYSWAQLSRTPSTSQITVFREYGSAQKQGAAEVRGGEPLPSGGLLCFGLAKL